MKNTYQRRFSPYSLAIVVLLLTGAAPQCPNSSPPPYNHQQAVGASARDFLAEPTFKSLIVEIQAVRGYAPTSQAMDQMKSFLEKYLHKSSGITLVLDPVIDSPGKTSYSVTDLRNIENANRKRFTNKDQLAAYFLFLDGASASDNNNGKVLGEAHLNTSVAIFEKTIRSYSGEIGQPQVNVLETTVMNHEFGHLLGLVNTGSPPQANHQDTPNGAHCTEAHCLMHWEVDTSNIIGNLLGGNIPDLDFNCINDLRANGGK